jgi:hypothetical protein
MARRSQISRRDAERALKVLKYERKTEVHYRRPGTVGSYLLLLLGLALAGLIVYYALNHREQIARLWYGATHQSAPKAQTQPDQ